MRLSTYLLGLPVAVVAGVVAVANRQLVTFSLDPFSSQPAGALSIEMPLFVLLLVVLAIGVVLGGAAAHLSRMKRDRIRGKAGSTSALPLRPSGTKPPEG